MIVLGGHQSYWTTFSVIGRHYEWRTSALWPGGGSGPSGGELPVHAVCPGGAPQVGAGTLHAGVGAHLSRRRVVRPVRTLDARHAVRVLTRRAITCDTNVNIRRWLICANVIINQYTSQQMLTKVIDNSWLSTTYGGQAFKWQRHRYGSKWMITINGTAQWVGGTYQGCTGWRWSPVEAV